MTTRRGGNGDQQDSEDPQATNVGTIVGVEEATNDEAEIIIE